jgi:hypothetical protein
MNDIPGPIWCGSGVPLSSVYSYFFYIGGWIMGNRKDEDGTERSDEDAEETLSWDGPGWWTCL